MNWHCITQGFKYNNWHWYRHQHRYMTFHSVVSHIGDISHVTWAISDAHIGLIVFVQKIN